MGIDIIFLIIFYGLLIAIFLIFRKRFEMHGILILYKTKLGLKLMEKFSKLKILNYISLLSVAAAFAGMTFIFVFLVKATIELLLKPTSPPMLAPVLPGIEIPGAPELSFWHWVISIIIVATVHEFSHGIFARKYNIPIKSSGFLFLGPLLGAFVEPDEAEIKKKPLLHQMKVFAAGPFANIISAFIVLIFSNFAFAFAGSMVYEYDGIIVNEVIEGYPMENTGIKAPFTIKKINNNTIINLYDFINSTKELKPQNAVLIETDKGKYEIIADTSPENSSKGFIGIGKFEQKIKSKNKTTEKLFPAYLWIELLLIWLFIINLGVGLFNLLPIAPLDGGRIFFSSMLWLTKNENKAKRITLFITLLCILFIFINLLPWVEKLFLWIIGIK